MALTFTDSNFDETVLQSGKLAVVDFWAQWCGPCRAVGPIIEQLANEYEGQAVIGKVDIDSNPDVAFRYKVRSIPTVLFIKDGEVVDKQVGAVRKSIYQNKIEDLLKK